MYVDDGDDDLHYSLTKFILTDEKNRHIHCHWWQAKIPNSGSDDDNSMILFDDDIDDGIRYSTIFLMWYGIVGRRVMSVFDEKVTTETAVTGEFDIDGNGIIRCYLFGGDDSDLLLTNSEQRHDANLMMIFSIDIIVWKILPVIHVNSDV